jgi:hypothetical protein
MVRRLAANGAYHTVAFQGPSSKAATSSPAELGQPGSDGQELVVPFPVVRGMIEG